MQGQHSRHLDTKGNFSKPQDVWFVDISSPVQPRFQQEISWLHHVQCTVMLEKMVKQLKSKCQII